MKQKLLLKMERNCADEKWKNLNKNEIENEEEEEALSLSDLPINEENQYVKEEATLPTETQEDFVFGSWGDSVVTQSEMCAADEVFFQGQILPLRHSVSSESGLAGFRNDSRNPSRCLSRSESMDLRFSGGFTSVTSRSSSITSHRSSSSDSTTTTTTTAPRYKPRVRNQFHSHPSPTPQIRFSSSTHGNAGQRSKKSTVWSFFRVGLARTPEIGLADLKVRSNNSNKNFGSRNSTSSTISSVSNGKDFFDFEENKKKKKRQRLFDINGALFGGCKCSVNAVERSVPSRIMTVKRSISLNEAHETKTTKQRQGKQAMSRRRTFEWLKQLSLEGAPDLA